MFQMECPYCKELIKIGAVVCKHCRSNLGRNVNDFNEANDEGILYLQNGFGKINAECYIIEDKIKSRTGFIFIKHEYSRDYLYEAIKRIESW